MTLKALVAGHSPLIFVEMGQAHEGSLNLAKSFIDLAADAGADAIKVQIHLPDHESSELEAFRDASNAEDATRLDYWKRTSFSREEWRILREHSGKRNLLFIASAFSKEAIDMCVDLDCDALKIGSAESLQPWFLEYAASKNLPTVVSTGMSSWREVEMAYSSLSHLDYLAIMHCTSLYPAPLEKTLVTAIQEMHQRFSIPIGYSDHSGEVSPSLYALALGALLIEVHGKFHDSIRGFDTSSSLTFDQITRIVEFRNHLSSMVSSTSKDDLAEELVSLRTTFGRSAAALRNLSIGDTLRAEDISFRKPGGGMSESEIGLAIGRKLAREVRQGQFFNQKDFEK